MKKRNPFLVSLFSLITFGVYTLFWLFWTKQEMVKKGAKIPPFWYIFLPFAGLFLAAGAILAAFVTSSSNAGGSHIVKSAVGDFSLLLGLAAIVGIGLGFYWLYKYCVGIGKVTKGRMSASASILLLIGLFIVSNMLDYGGSPEHHAAGAVVSVAWFGIIQYSFNQVGTAKRKA